MVSPRYLRDIDAQYDPQILRYLMLSAHYRSPLNFSAELMESARASYERIVTCMENLNFRIANAQKAGKTENAGNEGGASEAEQAVRTEAQGCRAEFENAMDDDFNTADALAGIFDLVKVINTGVTESSSLGLMQELKEELNELCGVLGLIAQRESRATEDETSWIEEKIAQRAQAKKSKDYARADAIRDELKAKGIVLEDTREGVKWKKI